MDPISLLTGLLSGAGGIVSSVIGQQQNAAAQQYQRQILEQLLQQYTNIPLPQLQQLVPNLLGNSAVGQLQGNPTLNADQMTQINNLAQEANQGGMTNADKAAMLLASNQAASNEQAQRSAIQNMLAARGLGGSGAAVGAMLAGQAQAQDRQAQAGQQAQVAARQRALQAMQTSGQMANQLAGQEFSQADTAAQAKDLFAQYNAQALTNAQQYNNQMAQQAFNDQMTKQNGISGAAGSLVGNVGATGAQQGQATAGIGQGISQGAAGLANYFRPTGGTSYGAGGGGTTTYGVNPNTTMVDPSKLPYV